MSSSRKNPNIKPTNIEKEEFTPKQVIEFRRCALDPIYFIENYVKIQHPVKGAIPFELYDYQKRMIKAFQDNRFTCVLSARQTGKCNFKSTLIYTIEKPKGFKKILLWVLDRSTYDKMFKL